MIDVLYGFLVFLSLGLLINSLKQYFKTQKLLRYGTQTTAKVIGFRESAGKKGKTYVAVFEYTNRRKQSISWEKAVNRNMPSYKIGERVKIIYDTNDKRIISFQALYFRVLAPLALAGPMLIIGGGYFLYVNGLL